MIRPEFLGLMRWAVPKLLINGVPAANLILCEDFDEQFILFRLKWLSMWRLSVCFGQG
jgi:hypothetical protein